MAFTNAVYYLDIDNGNDATRATFNITNYSNNGSGAVRVTYNGHGLTTGAVIDITGSSEVTYNSAWKITRIDANNFDLDASTYITNPFSKGTVAPRGGSSWADAFKTYTKVSGIGGVSKPINLTDTVRVKKSPDPVSIGNATWTDNSQTITLATAQTTTIDNCETAWTAANTSTVTRQTNAKQGTYYANIVLPATGITTNTKYAYFTLPTTLDLSTYQRISFWTRAITNAGVANNFKLCLCSDTTGDTIVDTFNIDANPATANWTIGILTKVGGGNLGSTINSIALYTSTVAPTASTGISFDNIFATTTNGLDLGKVISCSTQSTFDYNETWWQPLYIDNTTIKFTTFNLSQSTDTGNPYWIDGTGTTSKTVTTYMRDTLKMPLVASNTTYYYSLNTYCYGQISGGWNTATNTQDGMTFLMALNGYGQFYPGQYAQPGFNNYGFVNMYSPFHQGSTSTITISNWILNNIYFICNNVTVLIPCTRQGNFSYIVSNGGQNPTWKIEQASGNTANSYNHTVSYIKAFNRSLGFDASYSRFDNLTAYRTYFSFGYSYAQSFNYIDTMLIQKSSTALVVLGSFNVIKNYTSIDNPYAITDSQYGQNNKYYNVVSSGSLTSAVYTTASLNGSSSIYIYGHTSTDSVYYNSSINSYSTKPRQVYVDRLNNDTTFRFYQSYTFGSDQNRLIASQTTDRHTASGLAWQLPVDTSSTELLQPTRMTIARVAVNANSLVTVTCWVKASISTGVAKLFVQGRQLAGVDNDITSSASAANTNWQQLSISFTPTVSGVIEIELKAWASSSSGLIYVDDVEVTQ